MTLTLPKPLRTAEESWIDASDGIVAPFVLRPAEAAPQRYWVALRSRESALLGVIELFAPQDRFELVADEPPVPFAALRTVPAIELVPSLHASSNATLRLWETAASALPPEHPVPVALRLRLEDIARR
ncbi:hypothetical protein NNW99_06700 [Streptomyces sp. CRCS-T-1]|nr:hypothetical protein NNW98_06700 [Streptomyces koelreuteriae]UUA12846.1 hypothetical protein NNW99_06700 [Streptomyces sp. CRCS-T-1]